MKPHKLEWLKFQILKVMAFTVCGTQRVVNTSLISW